MKKCTHRIMSLLCAAVLLLAVVLPGISTPVLGASHSGSCKFSDYVYQADAHKATAPQSVSELIEKASSSDILAKLDYQNFSLPYGEAFGDVVVEDADALNGHAAKLSYAGRAPSGEAGLTGAMIISEKLELLSMSYEPESYDGLVVKAIPTAELQANAGNGYVLYKADNVKVMAAPKDSGNILQMFSCTGFQVNLDAYKDALSKKTVDVYLSMKVTGNVTNTTDNTPAYYIDSIIITKSDALESADVDCGTMVGTCIYGCGKTDVKPASDKHVQVFDASSFTLAYGELFEDKVITDKDSVMGSAVQYAAYPRRNETTQHLIMGEGKFLNIGTDKEDIAKLFPEELKADGKYHTYKLSFDSLAISSDAGLIYLLNDWGMQNAGLLAALKEYKGKAVDIYVSMKITGNIYGEGTSSSSAENWPVYCIDKVTVVSPCSFGEYTEADGVKSHSCNVCGLKEYAVGSGTPDEGGEDDGPVKTGDNMPLALVAATMLVSFCAMVTLAHKRKEQ